MLEYIDSHLLNDKKTTYIILDEVQLVQDFVEVLLSLLHTPFVDVYVSGSNSKFLSKDVVTVYRKMAADGLNFKVAWYSNNWGEVGRGRGEAKNGKFWHCMDFQATYEDLIGNEEEFDIGAYLNYIDHIDEYGNRCENDTTRVIVYGDKSSKVDILALPVKQILEKKISDLDWGGDIWKFPDYYSTHDSEEDMEMDEYNEYLRASAFEIDGIPAGYLLDKNGNKILSVKDFDHSVPDEDGNIYYPVRRDELVNDNFCTLTPEAEAKWRKKLGL